MRARGCWGRLAAILAAAAAVAPAAADQAVWLRPEWTARRVCDVTVKPSGQPGAEVGAVTFYSGGLLKPDGSDVRVAVKGTRLVPHRVLQIGPGDRVRVAFEIAANESRYFVYYGNPAAEAPKPWEPERGVLLEARLWPGGDFTKFKQVQQAWPKAKPLGADFVSHVSLGFNPFADSDRHVVFHYVGWFVPPKAGEYEIATSSGDGSWVLIDGKEVVSWPGPHSQSGHARHVGKCVLTAKVHRLDYWHVKADGPMVAVAAWNAPGEKRFEAIPPKAFLPVSEAALVELDLRGETMVADFFPERAGETWWPDQYAQTIRFANLSRGVNLQRGGRFDWDFGDGQKGTGPTPSHVYLAPGDYTVTLKASRGTQSNTFRTKIRVERDWWKQTERKIDPPKAYAEQVAAYDLKALDLASLALAVSLFEHEKMTGPLAAAASELALNRKKVPDGALKSTCLLLGRALREAKRGEEAVAAYRQVETRLKAPSDKAEVAVQIPETLLDDLYRYDEARKEYQRVLKAYASVGADLEVRRAQIGMGDIYRHAGDFAKAQAAYRAAAAIRVTAGSANEMAVRIGTLARYVEEYTRERDWEFVQQYLKDWAWEFPEEKLSGHWSLLRAQALVTQGDREEALREAMDVTAANPHSPYAVRLLILGGECLSFLGRKDQARALLQTAVDDYPEDPDQDHAREILQTLGGQAKPEAKEPAAGKPPAEKPAARPRPAG